jgi:hypothetical protein
MRITILVIFNFLVINGIFGQGISDTSSFLVIKGENLNELRAIDYNPIVNAFPRKIDRLKRGNIAISDTVQLLLEYANKLKRDRNRYYAYRYTIKAIALHYKEYTIEDYEVAAALRIMPQQGISDLTDTVVIKIEPLFDLGKPLSGDYTAQFSIRDSSYELINSYQFKINEIKAYLFKLPINLSSSGEYYIGYELITPEKLSMHEVPYTFLAFDGFNELISKLNSNKKNLQSCNEDFQEKTINETLHYISNCIKKEQYGYEGFARNFPAIARMQFLWDDRGFRQKYMGKVNFPYDFDVIQDYLTLHDNSSSLQLLKGDLKQAIMLSDSNLYYYRIYIPQQYQPGKAYPVFAIYPMGMEVDFFFNEQNYLRSKADDLGFIIICAGNIINREDNRSTQLFNAINRVNKIYGIDTTRLFLAGGGNSGDLVWKTGCERTNFFRAIYPMGGTALWLNTNNVNQNDKLQISLIVGNKEHKDIYEKVIKTKESAEKIFDNFRYIEIEDADHLSIWSAGIKEIMQELELLMK